ncbi:hypothetical protein SAMN05216345_111161 [Cupriavidus sp. YR651]|uniref:hypothetical protein n=1 Tax=Cupriavidus sp. YR651 TaxID=1855315 RepID=UPI000880A4C6|nr:hypothetical protein [Cupriavidus sp. YR651]SDD58792.1 hypothetical protein SAMN05216345_111161 [Cupriavidus sp. YR651]
MAESSEPVLADGALDVQSDADSRARTSISTPVSTGGPKPIKRLLSQDRVSRIIPDTDSGTTIRYCSDFVRDFLRSDYNFCTAKFSVASRSKIVALDERFREANEWMDARLAWSRSFRRRSISLRYDTREIVVTHSLAGRLIRLLNQHDQLFDNVLGAYLAHNVNDKQKDAALLGAARHISAIHRLCIPDNNRFSRDGKLLDEEV